MYVLQGKAVVGSPCFRTGDYREWVVHIDFIAMIFATVISMYCNLQYLLLTNPKLDKFGKARAELGCGEQRGNPPSCPKKCPKTSNRIPVIALVSNYGYLLSILGCKDALTLRASPRARNKGR
jgi:hypothetical protein